MLIPLKMELAGQVKDRPREGVTCLFQREKRESIVR